MLRCPARRAYNPRRIRSLRPEDRERKIPSRSRLGKLSRLRGPRVAVTIAKSEIPDRRRAWSPRPLRPIPILFQFRKRTRFPLHLPYSRRPAQSRASLPPRDTKQLRSSPLHRLRAQRRYRAQNLCRARRRYKVRARFSRHSRYKLRFAAVAAAPTTPRHAWRTPWPGAQWGVG